MAMKLNVIMLASVVIGASALALLGVGPRPLAYDTVYVDDGLDCQGNTPCVSNITGALALVNRSGTIVVYAGTYNESLSVDVPVTISGEGRDVVTVDAGWSDSHVVQVGNQDVTLEELTLVNADYGIEARSASGLTVRGVRITDTYGGIRGQTVDRFSLEDSEVTAVQAYDGIEIANSASILIDGSNVSNNAERGILVFQCTDPVITNNVITGNGKTGLNVSESSNATVTGNTIENNANVIPITSTGGPGPAPTSDGDSGGLRFWLTDPTAVEYNTVRRNAGFGIEIAGGFGFSLKGNVVEDTGGDGIKITNGVRDVMMDGDTIRGSAGWGILGENAMNVMIANALVEGNGPAPVPIGTRSADGPRPLQDGGGLRFWLTDPSEVRGSTIRGNRGPGIELESTADFDLVGNTVETSGGMGIVLELSNRSRLQGNSVRSLDPGAGTGTVLISSENVDVFDNAYTDLDIGIHVQDGCHIRFGGNTFTNVNQPFLIEGNPCDVTFAVGTLRVLPDPLNLRSQGQYVTLRIEVEGLDPSVFDLSALTFTVNGVDLVPPTGSPDEVSVSHGVIRAMVKLDRAEVIAAFGASGTYTVTVTGEVMPGVTWSASDTVEAILP